MKIQPNLRQKLARIAQAFAFTPSPSRNTATTDKNMNELSDTKLARKMEMSDSGAAGLRELVGFLNNPDITGAQVPKEELKVGVVGAGPLVPSVAAAIAAQVAENNPPIAAPVKVGPPENTQKIFFTGTLKVGKDHCASAANALVHGFADPLYMLASYFFGVAVSPSQGKDIPGCREFLQSCGQVGRGMLTPEYPMSLGRAAFTQLMRSLGTQGNPGFCPSVDWKDYGLNQDLWVDACLRRVTSAINSNPDQRIAVTNCRYMNEHKALVADGFTPWHVMTSPDTRMKRLAKAGIKPDAPALRDISEQMALRMDAQVTKIISQQPRGNMLHVIWNDNAPPPSPRLYTVNSFLQQLAIDDVKIPDVL